METETPIGVCGIGASAGGLDPLAELIEKLPTSLGIAYVVVQHLSPDHESMMVKLLGRRTSMKVLQLVDHEQLEPNCVYVLGPGDVVTVDGPTVSIGTRPPIGGDTTINRPIDSLFRSLTTWGQHAAAIVLSGTGDDGARGIVAVREAGGLTLVQDDSALFNDMPEAAERSGAVDAIGNARGAGRPGGALLRIRWPAVQRGRARRDRGRHPGRAGAGNRRQLRGLQAAHGPASARPPDADRRGRFSRRAPRPGPDQPSSRPRPSPTTS